MAVGIKKSGDSLGRDATWTCKDISPWGEEESCSSPKEAWGHHDHQHVLGEPDGEPE